MYTRVSQKTQMLVFKEHYPLFWLEWGSDPPKKIWWIFERNWAMAGHLKFWGFWATPKLNFHRKNDFSEKNHKRPSIYLNFKNKTVLESWDISKNGELMKKIFLLFFGVLGGPQNPLFCVFKGFWGPPNTPKNKKNKNFINSPFLLISQLSKTVLFLKFR